MAATTYFVAADAARDARKANALAADAHALLRSIDRIRAAIARDVAGDNAVRLHDAWLSTASSRNWIIGQWQQLTGRQWENYGENLTRV